MGLTKAKLEIEKEIGVSIIDVLFNPSEYQLTDSANYSEKKSARIGRACHPVYFRRGDGIITEPFSGYLCAEKTAFAVFLRRLQQRLHRCFQYYKADCRCHVH